MKTLPFSKYAKTAKNLILDGGRTYPYYASFKITSVCHFSCSFCNIWKGPKETLSLEDSLAVLRNLGRSSIFMTSLEGGEPLLHPHIEEILQEAYRQPFYLMLTTSQRNLLDYPWERWQKWVDFLEISIDEGHNNLQLFDALPEMCRYDMAISVQTVVRAQDQPFMERKTEICHRNGVRILLMPAVNLQDAKHDFPEFISFEKEVLRLKKKYPYTVITPKAFFRRVRMKRGGCSPSSIIINSDGSLYYPCRTLERKVGKMQTDDLMKYLVTQNAVENRAEMKRCEIQCGWYQYFATPSFLNPLEFADAFAPYFKEFLPKFLKNK